MPEIQDSNTANTPEKRNPPMKLLVIGGNGHYAKLITAHLSAKHEITVFDLQERSGDFECTQITGDIMKLDEIERATAGTDAIVTFFYGDAAVSTLGMSNVMTAAEQHGIGHVVYTSSGGLPFPIDTFDHEALQLGRDDSLFPMDNFSDEFWRNYFPITEEAGMFPGQEACSYFLYKWLCEEIGRHFAARGRVKFTSIRPGLLMHDDMTNQHEFEKTRHYDPFHMLMTGQVRVCDCAHLYDLAVNQPPAKFEIYNCSNDTPYNNLSVEKAKRQLGYACLDQQPYMDFYAGMDWPGAFEELASKGFPADMLRRTHGFREC
jgi:nucleoside-diphosphate-sugar epimerase